MTSMEYLIVKSIIIFFFFVFPIFLMTDSRFFVRHNTMFYMRINFFSRWRNLIPAHDDQQYSIDIVAIPL